MDTKGHLPILITIKPVPMTTMKTMFLYAFASLFLFTNCERTEIDLKERFIGDWCEYLMDYEGCDIRTIYRFDTNDTLYEMSTYKGEPDTTQNHYFIISENELEIERKNYYLSEYVFHSDNILEIKYFEGSSIMPGWSDIILIRRSACQNILNFNTKKK